MNVIVKGKYPRERLGSRWEQEVKKDVTEKQGRTWGKAEEEEIWKKKKRINREA